MKFNKVSLLISLLLIAIILTAGCISFHNENDYITTEDGYHYYFEDDNGRSFYETIYEGDVKPYVAGKYPMDWIKYVQGLKFIDDGGNGEKEIFYNLEETIARGGGDCEDKAILLARGLKELGVDTVIIIQPKHVTVGISKSQVDKCYKGLETPKRWMIHKGLYYNITADNNYYVIESTSDWGIGEYDENPLVYEKIYVV